MPNTNGKNAIWNWKKTSLIHLLSVLPQIGLQIFQIHKNANHSAKQINKMLRYNDLSTKPILKYNLSKKGKFRKETYAKRPPYYHT